MTKLCIYHDNCVDGLMAAAVISNACGDVEFYPAKYGSTPPYDMIARREIIIVDFSYPRDVMLKICAIAKSVLVLDHHKTAQAELDHIDIKDQHNCHIVFDMERSGAGLAWDYFNPGQPRPKLVAMVEDRDLWRFNIADSKDLHYALTAGEMSVREYAQLLTSEKLDPMYPLFLVATGTSMAKMFASQLRALKKEAFEREIDGDMVWVANVPYIFASELAGELAYGRPFAATYFFNGKEFIFSLRSRGEEGKDVSEIAKRLGGGGHKNAAGFKMSQKQINEFLSKTGDSANGAQ